MQHWCLRLFSTFFWLANIYGQFLWPRMRCHLQHGRRYELIFEVAEAARLPPFLVIEVSVIAIAMLYT